MISTYTGRSGSGKLVVKGSDDVGAVERYFLFLVALRFSWCIWVYIGHS